MRIHDRERYWAYLKAYVVCFTTLVGLYVIIDALSNLDEFFKRASGGAIFMVMGRYYLVHMTGVCVGAGTAAAVCTLMWMGIARFGRFATESPR